MSTVIDRRARRLRRVLFLCPDNVTLGRFCEEYFNSITRCEGLNWEARSRAVHDLAARSRQSVSPRVLAALRRLRAAPVNHLRFAQRVTGKDLEISDVLVGIGVDVPEPRPRPAPDSSGRSERPRVVRWELEHRSKDDQLWTFLAEQVESLVESLGDLAGPAWPGRADILPAKSTNLHQIC